MIAVLASLSLPLLSSCGLPGAIGRSYRRIADFGAAGDESGKAREMMFESLREVDRELDASDLNRPEAGSTR